MASRSTSTKTAPGAQPSPRRQSPSSSRRGGASPRAAANRSASSRRGAARANSPKSKGVTLLGVILLLVVGAVVGYLVSTAKETRHRGNASGAATTAEQLPGHPVGLVGVAVERHRHPRVGDNLLPQSGGILHHLELLGSEVTGESGREPGFLVDPAVDGCALPADYRHTGFDRGHMAPAGDMKWHPQAMRESFYMTNICPQAGDLNRGAWKKLEEKCRQRAQADSALVVVCGPVFDKSGPAARIGATGVAVPQSFFKVILAPFVEHPWAIGFIMPNGYVAGGMQSAAVSVDEVETLTGYDFFSALPDSIEDDVEARCDFNAFSRVPRRR